MGKSHVLRVSLGARDLEFAYGLNFDPRVSLFHPKRGCSDWGGGSSEGGDERVICTELASEEVGMAM